MSPLSPLEPVDILTSHNVGAGTGFLRATLLFGSALAMLGLILVTLLMQRHDRQSDHALFVSTPDPIITGAIKLESKL